MSIVVNFIETNKGSILFVPEILQTLFFNCTFKQEYELFRQAAWKILSIWIQSINQLTLFILSNAYTSTELISAASYLLDFSTNLLYFQLCHWFI